MSEVTKQKKSNLSEEQQLAVESLGQNIIVSASAGAGKTTVLIARLMKRIKEDKVRLDEVIALTFTEAAAKEMKNRLLEALHKDLKEDIELNGDINSTNQAFIKEQISLVETALITTIHAFCLSLIKNYGYQINLNPTRYENIMDETQTKNLKDRAFNQLMNKLYSQEFDQLQNILDMFSANPIDMKAFRKTLFSLAQFLNNADNPQDVIEETLQQYSLNTFEDMPTYYQTLFFDYHRYMLESLKVLVTNLTNYSSQYFETDKKYDKMFDQANKLYLTKTKIEELLAKISKQDLSFYDEVLEVLDFKLEADGQNVIYTKEREAFEKEATAYISYHIPLNEHIDIINQQQPIVTQLLTYALLLNNIYTQLKEEENVLDFDDFETYALEILKSNNGSVSKKYQGMIKEIMIDEFQDTNNTQDTIIKLVSNGQNIFRVGDIKQSIYKFRGAKPKIMQSILEDDTTQKIFLSKNFRSMYPIVHFGNTVFKNIFEYTQGIKFQSGDEVQVGTQNQAEGIDPVEIHAIETDEIKGFSDNTVHAEYIAQKIVEIMSNPKTSNAYSYKDIMILVRNHANKTHLKRAFEKYNIPHYIDDRQGFYQSKIILEVSAFLRYAMTKDPYYLVQILKSPYYNISNDELALYKIQGGSLINGIPQDLLTEIDTFVDGLMSMDIVDIIIAITNHKNTYATKLNIQDKTNMDALLEKAWLYQNNGIPTLSGFLQYLDNFTDDPSSEASSLSEDDDVVRAMTIHQSKGLEFPIVFVWGMGSHRVKDHQDIVLIDEDFGITMDNLHRPFRTQYKSLYRDLVEFKQDNEELEEDLRILYVAITRASKKLYLTMTVRSYEEPTLNAYELKHHKNKTYLMYSAGKDESQLVLSTPDLEQPNTLPALDSVQAENNIPYQLKKVDLPKYFNQDISLNEGKGMEYGTNLHEWVERLPHKVWKEEYETIPELYHRALKLYNENPLTQSFYDYEILHETPYIVEEENGIIDFLCIKEKEVYIVDFKTDSVSELELVERYTSQIKRYKEAIDLFYPEHEVICYIYSFHNNAYIKILDK